MFLRAESFPEKKFIGCKAMMSLTENRTRELWQGFMAKKSELINRIGSDLYSMQVYDLNYFNRFDPSVNFEKWAAMEVSSFKEVPVGMDPIIVPTGMYAVFIHKGPASEGAKIFQFIFNDWLPLSDYLLDQRPHFEILGPKYKHDAEDSEEEIWIPVKAKLV